MRFINLNILIIILLIVGILLGWSANELWNDFTNKRIYDGLWFPSGESKANVLQTATSYDKKGDWVCVNINGMSPERAFETCKHEVGHEIFAEYCEDDLEKCLEVTRE